jgi:alkylation response protein AidB-like acyl-CoA dehydrogenase
VSAIRQREATVVALAPRETPVTAPPTTRTLAAGPDRRQRILDLARGLSAVAAHNAPAHDRDNTFPHDTFAALRSSGYLALTVPEEYGGWGARPLDLLHAQEELARGDGSVALASAMHLMAVGGLADGRAWPPDLLDRLFRDVVERGATINGLASEPDLGSPSRGGQYATVAREVDGGYVVNGRKTWSTLSPDLSWYNVLLTIEGRDGERARGAVLIPAGSPGARIEETWDNLAMRATGSHDVVFEDVFVPGEFRLPEPAGRPGVDGRGWTLTTSAVYLGVATAARDFTVQYARDRVPSGVGRPIAELQTVQHRVAQIEVLLLQARSVLYATAEAWEQAPDQVARDALAWQFAAAKHTVTNHAITVTDLALRVVGSAGLQRRHPLERYFRDVRAGLGNPPMDDVALTIIGKAALGVE